MNIPKYVELYRKELLLKNYCNSSINSYVGCLQKFLNTYNEAKEPDHISEATIKDYLLSLNSPAYVKQMIGSLKIFYASVVKQPLKFKYIDYPRRESKIPEVFSKEEMAKIYGVIKNKKHKAIFAVMYSTGIRISELINLKITDINSERMLIRIEQGKGKKDRNVPLSEKTLIVLRDYVREYRPKTYLFNGQTIGGIEHLQYSKHP